MQKLEKTFKINPLYEADGYKPGHIFMLAPGTTKEYWTWIPRNLKYMPQGITKIMSAGEQMVWRYIHSAFAENFFFKSEIDQFIETLPSGGEYMEKVHINPFKAKCKQKALKFAEDLSLYFGMPYDGEHFAKLWDLGYLPVKIKALPEGMFTPPNVPHDRYQYH